MELGFLLTISCVMTAISMFIFIGFIILFIRSGGQGIQSLFDRFTGGGDSNAKTPQTNTNTQGQSPAVASSQSLRMRAQQLDFPTPAVGASAAAFGAQAAGTNYPDFPPMQSQQASLTPRNQSLGFDAKSAPLGQANSFQPSTPSLSPSRPFQEGSQFSPNQGQARLNPQQQNFGQQPLSGNQGQQNFGQAPQGFGGQQPLSGNQGQQGFPPPPNQQQGLGNQQGFNAQNFGQQPLSGNQGQQGFPPPPNQGQQNFGQAPQGFGGQQPLGNQGQQGFPPPPNQQQGFSNQGLGNQQGLGGQNQAQTPPPLGGLGQNRPPLRSVPRPGNTQYDRPIGGRDSRKGDDRDYIYDEGNLRGGNFMDDVGDFIDNV